MPAAERLIMSLSGHLVHVDGWCARDDCQRRHPYVTPDDLDRF